MKLFSILDSLDNMLVVWKSVSNKAEKELILFNFSYSKFNMYVWRENCYIIKVKNTICNIFYSLSLLKYIKSGLKVMQYILKGILNFCRMNIYHY